MRPTRASPVRPWLAASLLLVVVAWAAGFVAGWPKTTVQTAAPPAIVPPPNFRLFREVWEIVNREFYGPRPTEKAITYGAVRGLVAALDDPYAAFLPGDQPADRAGELGPAFATSLGAWVEVTPQGALVLSVAPGSASADKLRPHDLILAAGTTALAGRDRHSMLSSLQGPNNSALVLAVRRGAAAPFMLKLIRQRAEPPSLAVEQMAGDVAYLGLGPFGSDLVPALDRALPEVLARVPAAMVIDLRNNPGGDRAVLHAVASRLVEGPLYRERRRDGSEIVYSASQDAPRQRLPAKLAVLVNRGTVAEAEMLAAALRDGHQARLVGEPTFGKGRLQVVSALSDNSALRLTVSEWLTPSGVTVDGSGLLPDRQLVNSGADVAAGRDRQLEAALALLGISVQSKPAAAGRS